MRAITHADLPDAGIHDHASIDLLLPTQKQKQALCCGGTIPVGGIILWSGAVVDIPDSWALCDGNNSTPDLRNRFVVGAGSGYAVGATGGESESNLSHRHASGGYATDNDTHDHDVDSGTTASDTHDHDVDSGVTGSESAHTHDHGTYKTGGVAEEFGSGGMTISGIGGHNHWITTGTSGPGSAHTHGPGTLNTASDTHSHGPGTLNTDSDTHSHDVEGHSAYAGSSSQENRPRYYALAFIMRTA